MKSDGMMKMNRNDLTRTSMMSQVALKSVRKHWHRLAPAVLLLLFLAAPALADVVTLRPSGVTSAGTWTGVTAANLSDQADGTMATITNSLSTFQVPLANNAAYAGATINSVTIYVRALVSGGGGGGEKLDFGPDNALTGTPVTVSRVAMTNYSYTPATVFTPATVDSLEVDVASTTLGAGETIQVAEVWAVVDYTPPAGNNTINSCDGCHLQPPLEAASRTSATGAVVGSHSAHSVYACTTCHPNNAVLNHRGGAGVNGTEGRIDLLANIQGGTYSKGSAGFLQANDLTGTALGTCSNVSCHGGVGSTTPKWGSATGLACNGCHGAPPATNAHPEHYAAKGWGATDTAGVYCVECHPNNTITHTPVNDGVVVVDPVMSPSGVSPAITCGTAPDLGCHNGKVTPAWNTATPIACTSCHTVGGANVADPQTGLHNITAAGVRKHDATLTGGCQGCHVTKPATHTDGTFVADGAANTDRFLTRTNMTWTDGAANGGTCSGTGLSVASGCHSDGGVWGRLWSTAANSTVTTVGDVRCNVCHGQFGNWRTGTSHGSTFGTTTSTRGQSHNSRGGTTNGCEDCHSYPSVTLKHNTATHLITMNDGGATNVTETGGLAYCAACHSNDGAYTVNGTHTFKQSVFTKEAVSGTYDPVGSCTGCHGGGTIGTSKANYWPDGSNTNAENSPAQNKHLKHMEDLAAKRYGETIALLLTDNANGTSDVKQKALCDYCHRASAQDATHRNGTVEVFPTGYNKTLWNVADGGTLASYTKASDLCSNVDCHNSKATNVIDANHGWYGTGTTTCLLCHTVGGTGSNPTSGLHNTTAGSMETGKRHDDTLKPASGCAACHGMPAFTTTSSHLNGTFIADSTANTDRGLTGLYTDGAANAGTCSGGLAGAIGCHDGGGDAGTWARKWSNTADDGGTAGCANCHGGVAGTAWTFGGDNAIGDGSTSHLRNWDGDASAEVMANHSSTNACNTCHIYPDSPYNDVWGTGNHGNDKIDMNSTVSYTETSWNCTGACHSGTNNTGHNLEDSGWTVNPVAGPGLSCTGCHNGTGSGASKVSATSSHTDPDGAGTTYNATSGNCEVCHFASHATRTTNTVSTGWDARSMGTDYTADAKIYFKKLAGTETSEAEVCWNCHWGNNMATISPLVKEFGNTQGAYQTGTLSQRNWIGATWTSANFAYKNGAIASIHQAQSVMTADPALDTAIAATDVSTIGCTSCHDVHKLGNNGYTPTAAPYLRGTWVSNPFKEDGAPLSTQTMSSNRGAVPRGIATQAANGLGGWQIEQNNATFTETTYATHSGLCGKCHTQTKLEGLTWTGHKGAVSGFTGNSTNNFFKTGQRDGTSSYQRGHMSYQGTTTGRSGTWIGGLRNNRQWVDGIVPRDIDSLQTSGTTITYPFGAVKTITMDDTTYQNNFHNFPCSKCHSPHASRLPRLMITNCLDVRHNTWDDNKGIPKNWTAGTFTSGQLAYSPTAQNCHRYVGGTDANRELNAEAGWNTVTPW
ncbi:MAG: CxxxxCH/CxxCH domain-containing protein [Desulfuromonas sp.]|nr:CxxxxCH/CxxCH domain-containing protein [Desulfuromonas sp.]